MYLTHVPTMLFENTEFTYGPRSFLLGLVYIHDLTGQTGMEDEDGRYIEFSFLNSPTFPIPRTAFALFQSKQIDKDDLLFYVYLCYAAFKTDSLHIKIDIELIKKKTGLSKQKIKHSLSKFSSKEFVSVLERTSDKKVVLTALDTQRVDNLNEGLGIFKEFVQELQDMGYIDENGEPVESAKYMNLLLKDEVTLGLTWKEKIVMIDFMMLSLKETYTMEEILESIHEKEPDFSEFDLQIAIKKVEKADVFRVVINEENIVSIRP